MPPTHEILPSTGQFSEMVGRLGPLKLLFELICPSECVWCEEPLAANETMCEVCRQLFDVRFHACQRCGTQLPSTMPTDSCARCRKTRFGFDRVVALGPYRSHFQQAVLLSKKRQYEDLRRAMAELMASRLENVLLPTYEFSGQENHAEFEENYSQTILVPVPDHWTRRLNTSRATTSLALAHDIGQNLKLPVSERTVRRIRKTSKQGLLPWSQRSQNVRGAFEIDGADQLKGRHVVLVDDVLTSGATTSEIGRNLKAAAVKSVTVLVIARGTGVRE